MTGTPGVGLSPRFQWLIYAEVLVCFGLFFFDLMFGLIFLPDWIGDFIVERGSLPEILITLGGLLGSIGIAGTLCLINGWHPSLRALRVVQTFAVIGLATVIAFAFHFGLLSSRTWEGGVVPIIVPVMFLLVLPLACAAHLAFFARHQLLR